MRIERTAPAGITRVPPSASAVESPVFTRRIVGAEPDALTVQLTATSNGLSSGSSLTITTLPE